MELLTQSRFDATVLYWTQGTEVQKIEVSRSYGHNNPYMDITQYPHVDFCVGENSGMEKTTRENIAERLEYLRRVNPDLSTNDKIAERAEIGTNTVRRLRLNEENDVGIANVEAVARVFGLTLAEFVSPPGNHNGLDADELVLLHKYRQLKHQKDKDEVLLFASAKLALNKLKDDDLLPG